MNSNMRGSTVPSICVEAGHFALAPNIHALELVKGIVTSVSEQNTVFLGANAVLSLKDGLNAKLIILLGDLRLPPHMRMFDANMLPSVYDEALQRVGKENVTVVGQSRYRNIGAKKVADILQKAASSRVAENDLYQRAGVALFRTPSPSSKALYLTSDGLLESTNACGQFIEITHANGLPTCPTTVAGGLINAFENGVSKYIFFYDLADDPQVDKKLIGGAILAALAVPNIRMNVEINVLSDAIPYSSTCFELSDWAKPGKCSDPGSLLTKLNRQLTKHSPQWIVEGGVTRVCGGELADRDRYDLP